MRYLLGWWRAARGDAARRATPAHRSGLPAGAEYRAKTVQQCSEQPGPDSAVQAGRQQAVQPDRGQQWTETDPAEPGWSGCGVQSVLASGTAGR